MAEYHGNITVEQCCGILWQNIVATLQQDSTVAEFYDRMQQRYSKIVP